MVVENFYAVVGRKYFRDLFFQRGDVVDEFAINFVTRVPAREVFVERLFEDVQRGVRLEDLVKAGTSTARVGEEEDFWSQGGCFISIVPLPAE